MKKTIIAIIAVAGLCFAADYTPDSAEVAKARAAQADTNATTTVTGYTPAFVGQILVGGAGTGTNAVWVAKGVTTNDWVQVAP